MDGLLIFWLLTTCLINCPNLLIDKQVERYKNLIINHMEKYGFVRTLTSATYLEDSGYFNTPIQFLISIRKEDNVNE